jgi:hypothetical protein
MADPGIPWVPDRTEADYVEDFPAATVSFGPLGTDDNNALYVPETSGIFSDYVINSRYEKDWHIYMMPITSPNGFQGASVAFAQLASFTALWIVDWTAERAGDQPKVPQPWSNDPNWVLMDEHYGPSMLSLMGDGVTPIWRLSGTYVYGAKNPSTAMPYYPRPPWMEDVFDRTIDANKFTPFLIDVPSGAGTSFGQTTTGASGSSTTTQGQ